jgi:hypothetical protein
MNLRNDMIIYFRTEEDNGYHLQTTLQVQREHKLYEKIIKCDLYQK